MSLAPAAKRLSELLGQEVIFTEDCIDPETKAKQDNKNSPDLTHLREVVEGDTLPMMCYKIYGDCKYYLQVAEYNEIVNLSYLKPGQIIEFPPLTYASITPN